MLELRGVSVRRGPGAVVTDLTLTIRAGAVFWITGPNGAGKSSLLRVIVGLDPAAAGTVVGPDAPPLYAHSEMALPASGTVGGWTRLMDRILGDSAPGPGPLMPALDARRPLGALSTGERKRLLLDPLLRSKGPLVLDEPFEHLAPDAKADLAAGLRRRAHRNLVIVATNQHHRAAGEPGLRLEAGHTTPLGGDRPSPHSPADR